MIREEFNYFDTSEYLLKTIDLLIAGKPKNEDRSKYFFEEWQRNEKDILLLNFVNETKIEYVYYENGVEIISDILDFVTGIPLLLKKLEVNTKNTIIDLSGMNHVIIMYLTKVLITRIVPRTLFAAYIRPIKYIEEKENANLTEKIMGVKAVPGFAQREKQNELLCAFVGFEGIRLNGIIESSNKFSEFHPIIEFPSGSPQWYNTTMWNSLDLLSDRTLDVIPHKCLSESIFEAYKLLNDIIPEDRSKVLAPIGTRPHSMACAIYGSEHRNTRILYDYAIEKDLRTEGISDISIYHLSSFLRI